MAGLTLGPEADRNLFEIKVGSTILLRLPEAPTTGFRWMIESYDPAFLQEAGSSFELSQPPLFGSGGIRSMSFSTLQAGVTTLKLKCKQAWEQDDTNATFFQVTLAIGDQ